MEAYVLQSDEVLLYENQVSVKGVKARTNLILTNLFFIVEITQKLGFRKYETAIEKYPVEDIKFYNEKPQIIQKKENVTLYFANKEIEIVFDSYFSASKFVNKANEATTGKGLATRSAGSVKKAIGLVDDTLGINAIGTIAGVIENGVVKTLFRGIGKRTSPKTNNNTAEAIVAIANTATDVIKTTKESTSNAELSMEQRVEAVKKLKELLDIGAITQEDFDTKKKDILGL